MRLWKNLKEVKMKLERLKELVGIINESKKIYDPKKLYAIEYDEDIGEWVIEYGGDVIKLGNHPDKKSALKKFEAIMKRAKEK